MADELENIFNELMTSEKISREQKESANTLRQEVNKKEAELCELNSRLKDVRQEIETQNEILVANTADVDIADQERNIFREQLEKAKTRAHNSKSELESIKNRMKDETEAFIDGALYFCQRYESEGAYYSEREQRRNSIAELEKKKSALESQIEIKRSESDYNKSLKTEKSELLRDIASLEDLKRKAVSEKSRLESNKSKHAKQVEALQNAPNNDPQFLNLKRQIEDKERSRKQNQKLDATKAKSVEPERPKKVQFLSPNRSQSNERDFAAKSEYKSENNNIEMIESKKNNDVNKDDDIVVVDMNVSSEQRLWAQYQQRFRC